MPKDVISAYKGNEPYIFVSYARRDSDTVFPAIRALQERGFRVWVDTGIEAGTEWSNNIAEHLRRSSVFMAFISHASVKSENCLDEIAFAKSNKKSSLMVYVDEDAVLPQGTEMQTARFQRMFLSRQGSLEEFVKNVSDSPMLASCIGEADTTVPQQKERPAPALASRKKPIVPVAITVVALIAVAVLCISLFGKDSKPEPLKNDGVQDSADATDAIAPVMSDKLLDLTLKIDTEVYQLPFDFSRLVKNGWTISSSGDSSSLKLAGMSSYTLTVAKDGSKLFVTVYNDTGNARTVADCRVGAIEVQGNFALPLELARGITVSSTVSEILEAYSTPTSHDSYTDREKVVYSSASGASATFVCYGSDKSDYSYFEFENYAILSPDTETSTLLPDYLSSYASPSSEGDSINAGVVKVNEVLYSLPSPLSEFTKNGWAISSAPGYVVAGGTGDVTLALDGKTLDLTIANFSDLQTLPANCAVVSVSESGQTGVLTLPLGIKLGMSREALDAAANGVFSVYEGIYTASYSYSEYKTVDLSVNVSVSNETGLVERVSYKLKTWHYGK